MQDAIPWSEHARLRAESQRIRAQAIRVRIAAVHAYCSVVESEARWESPQRAQDSMGKVWRALAELKRHLAEPKHVPDEAAGELLNLFSQLEDRALRIHQSVTASLKVRGSEHVSPIRGRGGKRDPRTSG